MLTVLFFDDEPMVGSGFARFFKRRGIALDAVSDKDAFDRKVREGTHRIIGLDELLGGSARGSILCRDLRVRGESRPILLTSHATSDAEGRALADECGADLYVPKFDDAVYRALRALEPIDPRRPPPVPKRPRRLSYRHAFTHEQIEIDLDRSAAISNNATLALTPTQLTAFAYLLQKAPEIVTASELRAKVWKVDSVTASAISNIVGQLIDRVPGWIERVGRGYRARIALRS